MRPTRSSQRRTLFYSLAAVSSLVLLAACDQPDALTLEDLTPAETRFVERFVQLERARAVALVDRDPGLALLDSLAAAWGDSALAEARAAVPEDLERQARLLELLEGVLLAERDSLLEAPRPDRLTAPLPAPRPDGS